MTLQVWLLLLNCVLVGAGVTYFSGIGFSLEERVSYGAFLGLIVFVLTGLITASLFGFSGTSVTVAALISLAIGAAGFALSREQVQLDLASFGQRIRTPLGSRENPAILAALLIPSWIIATRILVLAYHGDANGGLGSGHLATYSDWQAHLTYTASFAFADNMGFNLPMATGEAMQYHNGINFFAASLIPAGASLHDALTISLGYCAFAFPAVMYLVGVRIFERRLTALLGTLLFFLFGGWGWINFLEDLRQQGRGILGNLPVTYTRLQQEADIWIENPVIGHLFPQRPTAIGFPITLMVCAILWQATKTQSIRAFTFAGVIVGLMPFFNLFGYGTPLALGIIWAGMDFIQRKRNDEELPLGWLYFIVPAVLISLVPVMMMLPDSEGTRDLWYGWATESMGPEVADTDILAIIWFWVKNFGFFIPLLLVAQFWKGVMPRRIALASIPIWLWFIVPNFIKPHPWPGNNTHYFVFLLLLGAFPVAALLVKMLDEWKLVGSAIVGALALSMTLAGILDISSAADSDTGKADLMNAADVAAGTWARNNTPNDAVFVIAGSDLHLHPVPVYSGRPVVVGFAGWIYDLGVSDWGERDSHSKQILQGVEGHQALIERYGVDYVVIGPHERAEGWNANVEYWDAAGQLTYDFGGYRIYEVG